VLEKHEYVFQGKLIILNNYPQKMCTCFGAATLAHETPDPATNDGEQ
jgi:hypothetical protein